MSLMQVPRHERVDGDRMLRVLREARERVAPGRVGLFEDTAPRSRRNGVNGWTRVPYLKLVLEGRMRLLAGSGRSAAWLEPGDVAVFGAGSHVSLDFPEPVRFLRVTFDVGLTLLGEGVSEPGFARRSRTADEPIERLAAHVRTGSRPQLMEELLAVFGALRSEPPRARRAWADLLLWELERFVAAEAADGPAKRRDGRWREILNYIEENCGRPLSRDTVAGAFGLSGAHLARLFRDRGGEGFQATLVRLRICKAKDLLRHTRLPVEEIALRCGFTSANYFTQAFRRVEGCAPRGWRSSGAVVFAAGAAKF